MGDVIDLDAFRDEPRAGASFEAALEAFEASVRLFEEAQREASGELAFAEGAVFGSLLRGLAALALALARQGRISVEDLEEAERTLADQLRRFLEAFDSAYPDLAALRRQATKRGA